MICVLCVPSHFRISYVLVDLIEMSFLRVLEVMAGVVIACLVASCMIFVTVSCQVARSTPPWTQNLLRRCQ